MGELLSSIFDSYENFFNYLVREISFQSSPWYINYFWGLILFSGAVYLGELLLPWRKQQSKIRKDFGLDAFYMFFNYFIFRLLFFAAAADLTIQIIDQGFGLKPDSLALFNFSILPPPVQLLIFFLAMDFVQWACHMALHKIPRLWTFHKVHHSVEQMGFAAHLRFHWLETLVYSPAKYITLMLLGGFEPKNVFLVYYLTTLIGHLNHANIPLSYGPLKYILNNPVMHIWHHSRELKPGVRHNLNFGISLSLWDYLFGTAWIPRNGRDIELGFEHMDTFPKGFWGQMEYPFRKNRNE